LLHFICEKEDDEDEEESMAGLPPKLLEISFVQQYIFSACERFLLEWLFGPHKSNLFFFVFGNEPI
jgi:hypothetical protein